tara:strand:+ start:366 stop:1424 length:1059 start_codon:yes stop_codon:yes gene_type:complete
MAKTFKHLWEQIIDWDNLLLAYQKCRRRKRFKSPATVFDYCWENHLTELQRELSSGHYAPGEYRHFFISDPKPRKISAAPFRDRVVHHALVNILEPIYERRFIFDSFACRTGKGTHRAIDRAQYFLRRYDWCLKTDIVRFFPNIDHELLTAQLSKMICDSQTMQLISTILHSGVDVLKTEASCRFFPGDNLFSLLRPRGLPIGNLTSQFLANVFLDPLDHFIKEDLKVPGYVRYADDLLLFSNSKRELWNWRDQIVLFLEKQRLHLHPNKTHIRSHKSGVSFLGFRLSRLGKRLKQEIIRRFKMRIRRLRWKRLRGEVTFSQIEASLKSWLAHASQANSIGVRQDLWRELYF